MKPEHDPILDEPDEAAELKIGELYLKSSTLNLQWLISLAKGMLQDPIIARYLGLTKLENTKGDYTG